MLDKLFEYHRNRGNYEKAKEALLKSYEFVGYGNYYKEYERIKNHLDDAAWVERFSTLKVKFSNRPAFLDESRNL